MHYFGTHLGFGQDMKFDRQLLQGRLKKRYKRFFADVELDTGELVVAHCPNTGSMKNCLVEKGICWLSESDNPKRKLAYTLEAVTAAHGGMAGVNTGRTNKLVGEALQSGLIKELGQYGRIEREIRFGEDNSRLDFRLSRLKNSCDEPLSCYVEVKNVTLGLPDGLGMFPDSVTARGARHLRELALAKREGHRAVLFFCVQHQGIDRVVPAKDIDPAYHKALVAACEQGVEVIAYATALSRNEFLITGRLPFELE